MISILILCGAALLCIVGVLLCLYLGIKYRDEEFSFIFVIGIILCIIISCASISEAIKRADAYERITAPDER